MEDFGARARSAYGGMRQHLWDARAGLYHEATPTRRGDPRFAYLWPYSQALATTLDLARLAPTVRADVAETLRGLEYYWDARPAFGLPGYDSSVRGRLGRGGDKFYDDNLWVALDLLRAHRLTGDAAPLARAEAVYAFVADGWCAHPCCEGPAGVGGIFWKQQTPHETNHDRNTVSTAPAAELALGLARITGQNSYADAARTQYAWVNSILRDADDLYWDHVFPGDNGACAIEQTKWSYNQGTMIVASVLLSRVSGDPAPLATAQRIAHAALAYYGCAGPLTAQSRIFRQDVAFNAIFFRNLLLLDAATGGDQGRRAMCVYADAIWNDPAIHQRLPDGASLFQFQAGRVTLLDQAAITQVFACLAMPTSDQEAFV